MAYHSKVYVQHTVCSTTLIHQPLPQKNAPLTVVFNADRVAFQIIFHEEIVLCGYILSTSQLAVEGVELFFNFRL